MTFKVQRMDDIMKLRITGPVSFFRENQVKPALRKSEFFDERLKLREYDDRIRHSSDKPALSRECRDLAKNIGRISPPTVARSTGKPRETRDVTSAPQLVNLSDRSALDLVL